MPSGVYGRRSGFSRKLRIVIIPIGPSIAYVPLTKGLFACIDSEDASRVGCHNWRAQRSREKSFYAYRNLYGRRNEPVILESLQSFIRGAKDGLTVDHKLPGNGLDCRRANLRHATSSQQSFNQGIRKDNTSGYKGVSFHPQSGKWRAMITANRKNYSLGLFAVKEEAYLAYCQASEIYHGEFRRIK